MNIKSKYIFNAHVFCDEIITNPSCFHLFVLLRPSIACCFHFCFVSVTSSFYFFSPDVKCCKYFFPNAYQYFDVVTNCNCEVLTIFVNKVLVVYCKEKIPTRFVNTFNELQLEGDALFVR